MSNYVESKKELDKIRREYNCQGDIIFRTAIQYVIEQGQENFKDDEWYQAVLNGTNERHDKAEAEGKVLFIGRNFEIAILECAKKLATIGAYDLLIYVQREVFLSSDGIDPQRAIMLLKNCLDLLENSHDDSSYFRADIRDIGLLDDEIEFLGYDWLYDDEMEDEHYD